MSRTGRATMMLVLGIIVLRLAADGSYGWFLQQRMQIPIILAGIMLTVFGVVEVVGGFRDERADPESLRRSVGPAVGWLLVLPIVVLIAVAPTSLNAAAAQRAAPLTPTAPEPESDGPAPIDDSAGPVELRVYEFLSRALWDTTGTLSGKQIVLEGLVVNDPEIDDGFRLTRFAVSCCAADGLPLQVGIRGVDTVYDDDTWVRATVVWRPPPGGDYRLPGAPDVVEADVVDIEVIDDPPTDPYETPF